MKPNKIIYWLPRIICILAIVFISLFALDSFDSNHTIGQQLLAFLVHMIPTFVLIGILVAAWKWERIGGWFFVVVGILFSPIIFRHNYHMNHSIGMSLLVLSMITFPFIIVGVLFLLSHRINANKTI